MTGVEMTKADKLNKQLAVGAVLVVALMGLPHSAIAQQASPVCECIDPWAGRPSEAQGTPLIGLLATGLSDGTHQERRVEFPSDYGAGSCNAWDNTLENGCVDRDGEVPASGRPAWCPSVWCYVNSSTCERPYTVSHVQWEAEVAAPDDLTYSYETCGNLDTYASEKHFKALHGKDLRVSFPGDSSYGYDLYTNRVNGRKNGAVVELMEKISEEAGFTWHIHIVGNKSNEKFSSSYTACVHEVALNETDFCIGSFWMTTERLLMTPFTGNIHRNDFKLVVYATEEFDYWSWSIITGPLMPFTTRAWLAICAVVFYVSLSLRVIEGDGLGLHKDKGDVSLTDHAARTMGVHVEEHLALALLDRFVSGAIKCVYNSIIAITQGIHAEEVKTFPGRVVSSGFAVFGLIFLATYTGSTAAALLVGSSSSPMTTLADVKSEGGFICVRHAILSTFLLRYPEFRGHTQSQDNVAGENSLLQDMDAGLCSAAVIMEEAWDKVLTTDPEHCNKVMVGGALLSQGNAMPVRDAIEVPLSYLLAKHIAGGTYEALLSQWKKSDKIPGGALNESPCNEEIGTEEDDDVEGFRPLSISHMAGPFAIALVSTTLGLAIYFMFGYALDDVVALADMADNLGGGANMIAQDAEVCKQMRGATFKELWDRAKAARVPNAELAAAIDAAPDKELLIQTVFKFECSEVRRKIISLKTYKFSTLCELAVALKVNEEDFNGAVNHDKSPKDMIIKTIIDKLDVDHDGAISESELQVAKHILDKFNVEHEKHLYTGSEEGNQGPQMAFENPLIEETFDDDETKDRARAQREAALRAESDSLFSRLDRNGDGALSRQEVKKGLAVIEQGTGLALAGKKAKEAFSYLSVSGKDGQVDADEFFAFVSTAQERAASDRLFGQLDKSGDGLLTRREIEKGMKTISETSGIAMKAKEVIGAADTSGGGKLDRDEFFTFLMANKTHDDVGSFQLGDNAVWLKSDEDVPDGTLGTVCGFKANGRIRLRFDTLEGKEFSFTPAELAKIVEDKDFRPAD